MSNLVVALNAARVTACLAATALFLVVGSVTGQVSTRVLGYQRGLGFVHLFDVDAEGNLPAYFSALLLLFAALLLFIVTSLRCRVADPDRRFWALLAFGFLFLSVDEAASIHELLIKPIRKLLGGGSLGILYFTWVVPGFLLVTVLAVHFRIFIWRLPSRTRWRFLSAGAAFVGGSLGVEMLGGQHAEVHGLSTFSYSLWVTLEESLEMTGVILFIRALLIHLAELGGEMHTRFERT